MASDDVKQRELGESNRFALVFCVEEGIIRMPRVKHRSRPRTSLIYTGPDGSIPAA